MLVAVAALNRIGAVVVLMRPGGDLAREAALGDTTRIVTDPEHLFAVREQVDAEVLTLGGGARSFGLGVEGVIDLETVDPDTVTTPTWYRANPGRARDIAFVLFSGDGSATQARAVTNARWARAAFGTAVSAELTQGDTVFSVDPVHHPSGLLLSLGAALASGARFSMAARFDARTFRADTFRSGSSWTDASRTNSFWDEARRYRASVVSCSVAMLREIVEAPPHPGERHHGIRVFIGSGMPAGLWHRVAERIAPAKVVELYVSATADAMLVNSHGVKVGCKGTPLPGGPELRIAGVDEATRQVALLADGSARQCRAGEIGMLLARADPHTSPQLRGLFAPDDAWLSTHDLFYQDEDGDFWLAGSAESPPG
jgi:putative long chain acyl-CoA synthase